VATGALGIDGVRPERAFKRLDPDVMARAFAINAIGPAMLVKHLAPKLPRDAPCFFAALSARIGSIGDNGLGGWMSYRAAKAALNQTLRCAALEMKRSHKQSVVVALHPGTIETNLTRDYARGRFTATADAAASQLLDVIEGLSPAQTGTFWDYAGKPIPW
jgi:NAD(P)-dependent dehydrogenase (short-subunit alcohol dehydrogenase family)